MAEEVIIQVDDKGEFPNVALFAAWRGFQLRGRDVAKRSPSQIEDVEARPERLVFGGAEVVRGYLGRLGIHPPNLDYPAALREFLGREFEVTTLAEIRRAYNEPGPLVFIKPVVHKEFAGHLVRNFRDLLRTTSFPSTTLVYKVEYVSFISEWRFYVRGSKVVGSNHYNGEPLRFPDASRVGEAARAFYGNGAPYTYALDFGVTEDGETCLVEVNDMISLGSYGLDPGHYAMLIERRWDELMAHCELPSKQSDSYENVKARYAAQGYCTCGSRFEDHRRGDPPCDGGYRR